MSASNCVVAPIENLHRNLLRSVGATLRELSPIGALIEGFDLAGEVPSEEILQALESVMANRGFLVFRADQALSPENFLRASCWWGGRELHSTHSVHPATPAVNPHIFRLSNDPSEGILGVGPQWHNDGSFIPQTFSHAGYHMVRAAEQGGGTYFSHQAAAYEALQPGQQEYWSRLSSVNSASGVVHPLVHQHPITGHRCIWLHLGMTGAVVEKLPTENNFRLLDRDSLTQLCRAYASVLDEGIEAGYTTQYEYRQNDCVFVDNLAVAHRAAPQAHLPSSTQGTRILHRSTVRGIHPLLPLDGLPAQLDIYGPSPFGDGIWQPGGTGFRWDADAPMQN